MLLFDESSQQRTIFPAQIKDPRYQDVHLADPARIRPLVEDLARRFPEDLGAPLPMELVPRAQHIAYSLYRLAHEVEGGFSRPGFLTPIDELVAALRHFCCEFQMMGRAAGLDIEHAQYVCGDVLPVLDQVLLEDQLSS